MSNIQFSSRHKIPDKTFTYINEIKPKCLKLYSDQFDTYYSYDFIQILSNLQEKMKIWLDVGYNIFDIKLSFTNTMIKFFQKDKGEYLLVQWKSFSYFIDQYDNSTHIAWSTLDESIHGKNMFLLHIKN